MIGISPKDAKKRQLRIVFKQKIVEKDSFNAKADLLILYKVFFLLHNLEKKTIGIYSPNRYEVNLFPLVPLLSHLCFCIPKIQGERMIFTKYQPMDQLYTNRFGVQETIHDIPFLPEILLIPGLAFCKKGYRLGYGGGYYDRYLAKQHAIQTMGICRSYQLYRVPFHLHDQKVQSLMTESTYHICTSP